MTSWTNLDDQNFHFYTVHEVCKDTSKHVVVGYLLVFRFTNPFRKDTPYIYRVCQVVVIPPYRKQGHGYRMLATVYKDASDSGDVFEVNVEDPCLEFVILRDVLDVRRCIEMKVFDENGGKFERFDYGIVPAERIDNIRKKAKITDKQIQRCYELIQMMNMTTVDDEKRLRLDIKRRLRVEHGEELDSLQDVDQVKEQLKLLYSNVEAYYKTITEKAKRVIGKK